MPKLHNPATISSEFKISREALSCAGAIDATLSTDTLLFIDPVLLRESAHKEISEDAYRAYEDHFLRIIKLLRASQKKGDVAWKAAARQFKFSEVSWTCLGYGKTTEGSGFGPELTAATLETANQIVKLDVDDVDLFLVLALFEDGVGPDRISDMTTNIIFDQLVQFTQRVSKELNLPQTKWSFRSKPLHLPKNPLSENPLLLVPNDIVRKLPIACDWSDISRVVNHNDDLRDRVNTQVGSIFARMSRHEKSLLKKAALRSKEAFETMLDVIKEVHPKPYDFKSDPDGEDFWKSIIDSVAKEHPLPMGEHAKHKIEIEEAGEIVSKIISQFRDLIENKGLWKEMWSDDGQPRKEKAAQRLFFAIAYSYCKANNLDLTPEADAGNGPVDFKVSQGFANKIVVEIKLSTGTVVHGYEKQLEIYKAGEDTDKGVFLVVDVGGLGNKLSEIEKIRSERLASKQNASAIWHVDAQKKKSASKR